MAGGKTGNKKKREQVSPKGKNPDESDENSAKKHDEILREQIGEGLEIYERKNKSLFISSYTAGLEIGFSFLVLCTIFSFFDGRFAEEVVFKLMTFGYPVGFIMVILGRSILYTEQTSLLTLPVLNKNRPLGRLLKLWGLVIAGNLVGGYVMSLVILWIGPKLGIFELEAVTKIALHVVHPPGHIIFISAILAGWLMALLSWLLTSSKDTMSRLFIIYLITAVMSFTGLHHSILGSAEIFAGLLISPEISLVDYSKFMIFALIGNTIGGVFFVALLKYRVFVKNIE